MTKLFKVGDKVKIKDRTDWPSPPGYRLANLTGRVVEGLGLDDSEETEEFRDFVDIQLDKDNRIITLRSEGFEKV